MPKKPVTSRSGRFFKLAGMTASVAGQYAGQKARSFMGKEATEEERSAQYEKMADQIVDTLGELKGAVMKVGQIVSQTQDLLPKEFATALQKLQKEAPPMEFGVIREQVERELGKTIEDAFASFDEKPYASASIGQVHRARLHSGEEVIVKVQYPGVEESCDSDMRHLRTALRLSGLIKIPKESADGIFNEIRDRLKEELDYENEARNLTRFHEYHKDDPSVLIPKAFPEHSTRRVLTLELLTGDHIDELSPSTYPQEIIDQIGERIFKVMGDHLFRLQAIHADPHPGNFAFRPDGTLIIYDFGCVKDLRPDIVAAYRNCIIAGLNEEYELLDGYLTDLGARIPGSGAIEHNYYAMWRGIFLKPFLEEAPFDFGKSTIHQEMAAKTTTVLKYLDRLQPPVHSLYIDRMITGQYWNLKKLGARVPCRIMLRDYLQASVEG